MKNNFTPAQLKWASKHDWYVGGNLAVIMANHVTADVHGNVSKEQVEFTNFQSLRDWAGY